MEFADRLRDLVRAELDAAATGGTLDRVAGAAAIFKATEDAHEIAREAVNEAVAGALKAGDSPGEVAERAPYSAAYVRRIGREAGAAPAKPGPKPSKEAGHA